MEKTPRYTQRERNMVLGYAAQYKDVIENKRTDAESNRKKDEVWLQIAKEFNSKVYHQRSAKQLRQLYKNMKLLLKKDLCGEDKGNRSFMDLLNTLSQQESVAQYIAEQMSPDGAGSQAATNGRHMADDFEDSKPPLYEGMDTDVILIKSETISDNEQTENGMDCMDDDDDEDCNSPKVPEVCLEEEDEVLFATDLRHMQQQSGGASVGGSLASINGSSTLPNGSNNNISDPLPRAPSSPVCSTKTSISSTGSYISASVPKAEITLSSVGNIRVGAFASINKTLQNGNNNNNSSSNSCSSNNNNNNNNSLCNNNNNNSSECNNNSSSNNNNNNSSLENGLQLTAEQVNQHLLLNGLGLSAVQHAPSQASMQAAINAATSGVGSSRQTQTLQLPRLQRGGHNSGNNSASTAVTAAAIAASALAAAAGGANGGSGNASGVQVLLNGHHRAGGGDKAHAQLQQQQQQQHNHHHHQLSQQQQTSGLTVAAGSFNGYNGLGVSNISSINCGAALAGNSSNHNNSGNGSNSNNHNNSGGAVGNGNHSGSSSSGGSRGQHNEYMMSLALEERKRKIELLNVQIEYWQTLTKKLDSQSGHFPNPACLCHFPGNTVLGAGVAAAGGAVGGGAAAAAAAGAVGSKSSVASALQTQSSSS